VGAGMKEKDALEQAKKVANYEDNADLTSTDSIAGKTPHIPIVQASDNRRYIAHFNKKPIAVLTSGGISAGIDASFAALQYLLSREPSVPDPLEVVKLTRYRMEYYYGIDPSFYTRATGISPAPGATA